MQICVIGAGAVGSVVAGRLAASGEDVRIVARGARLEKLRREGIYLRRRGEGGVATAPVLVCDALDVAVRMGVQDVVFTAVKGHSLPALLPTLAPLIGPETMIVPLVNGIPWWYGSKGDEPVPRKAIVGCVVYVTAAVQSDGVVETMAERLTLGEIDKAQAPRARMAALAGILNRAGIDCTLVDDIRPPMWTKVALNLSTNPLSVVSGATVEEQFTSPRLAPILLAILEEVRALAAAGGEALSMTLEQMIAVGRGAGPIRTSMLQDLDAGRPIEWSAIVGACLDLAEARGVAMPVSRIIGDLAAFRAASIA